MPSIIHSPNNLKSLFSSHRKKPSQSSLLSVNNIIIGNSNNVILTNTSSASINNINAIAGSGSVGNSNSNNNDPSNNTESTQLQVEDIEIMKQRSANNNTFLCIKIPEIQLLVSYNGSNKDKKNFKDLSNVCLLFPLFEVHDKTWTWLDLINALKSHVKKALLSQAIRHKLIKVPIQPMNKLINRGKRSNSQQLLTHVQIEEHEKLAMLKLFGSKYIEKKMAVNSALMIKEESPKKSCKTDDEKSSVNENEETSQASSPPTHRSQQREISEFHLSQESFENSGKENAKGKIKKSNSTLSNAFKKRFMKFTKEKTVEEVNNGVSSSKNEQPKSSSHKKKFKNTKSSLS